MIESEQQNAENEKKIAEVKQAYFRLFATPDGRVVWKDLELFCGFLKTSTNVQWNPYQTFFAEGKRRVFLHINSRAKIDKKKENENA